MRHLSLLGCILLSVLPVAAAVVPTNAFADGTWQFLSSFLCNADDIAIDSQHNVYVLDMGEYPLSLHNLSEVTPLQVLRGNG